jgi:hypothetical protein
MAIPVLVIAATLLPRGAGVATTCTPKICPNGVVVYDTVCPAVVPVPPTDGFFANDVAMAPDAYSAWAIGTVPINGGYNIQQWSVNTRSWESVPGGATRIAVAQSTQFANPFVINNVGAIYQYTGSGWQQLPGSAVDIAVAGSTGVWVTLTNGSLCRWNATNSSWYPVFQGAGRVAVALDSSANPWTIDTTGKVSWQVTNTGVWTALPPLPSGTAIDIGVTRTAGAFVLGSDHKVWRWQNAWGCW